MFHHLLKNSLVVLKEILFASGNELLFKIFKNEVNRERKMPKEFITIDIK